MNQKRYTFLIVAVVVFVIAAATATVSVVAHLRHQASKVRPGQISAAELARQRSTAPVINSLPPLTDANHNLTLSIESLVGRWESQDGTRTPIRFYPDGTVELGFNRKGGVWLMSKGSFTIDSDRVVTKTKYQDIGRGATFRFARGVLYAPNGPSPRVVWQRLGDLQNGEENEAAK